MSPDEDYQRIVEGAILDAETFVKATFSGRRRGYELPWRRVTVRPVAIQGARHLQVSHLDEKQDTTKNYTDATARDKVRELLALPFSQIAIVTTESPSLAGFPHPARLPFSQIAIVTTEGEIQVQISRKGSVRVSRRRAQQPGEAPPLEHDRRKPYLLPGTAPDPLLQALEIQTPDGQIRAGRQRKYRQINEFLRLIVETEALAQLDTPIRIVDCGCGSADLTFAVYHYLSHSLALPVQAVGVDVKAELMAKQNALAAELGWTDLRFEVSRIIDYQPEEQPDIVLALHACDTATDEALAQAVKWGAHLIFSAPCCHHNLQAQMSARPMPPVFRPVLRHGILKDRLGDVLTDSLRAQIMRIMGYRTDVVEFISPEHTNKNLMICATKSTAPGDLQSIAEYRDLVEYWHVQPYLAQLLAHELAAVYSQAASEG